MKHHHLFRTAVLAGSMFVLHSAIVCLHAQVAAGRITGTIKDVSGAVVPGVKVTLSNGETGTSQVVTSTSTGTYTIESVNPGNYSLKAEASGFSDSVTNGIQAHVQQTLTVDVSLVAGSANQEVTVTSAASLLQAADASIGQTINTQQVNDLPLSTRDWNSLAQLSAGVVASPGGTSGSPSFVANGAPSLQNNFLLDGIDNNLQVYGGTQVGNRQASNIPPPDAIEEFKLQTGDYSAEIGQSTGAVINAVVKSGTNHIHGDLWEYVRNTVLNANGYFANQQVGQRRQPYHQNQFGGTVGGPIVIPKLYNGRDKTFFFFDYQGTRISSSSPSTSSVPTLGMRNSNFTNFQDFFQILGGTKMDSLGRIFPQGTILDPATTRIVRANSVDPSTGFFNVSNSAVFVRDPFYTAGSVAGVRDFTKATQYLNQLPAARLDPNAVKLLSVYPLPDTPLSGGTTNYHSFASSPQVVNSFDTKIDETFSPNDVFFGVFDWNHTDYSVPQNLPGLAVGQNYAAGNTHAPRYSIALSYTHVFSPTLTNEAHAGWSHFLDQIIPFDGSTPGIPASFGIQGVPNLSFNGGLPPISISGFSGIGVSGYIPTLTSLSVLDVRDSLTKLRGPHTIKGGFQLQDIRSTMTQPPAPKGNFSFNGQYSDIPNQNSGYNGTADLLLKPTTSSIAGGAAAAGVSDNIGGLSSYSASNTTATRDQRYYLGAYLEDDWKASSNLTLNLGLRWDHYTPYQEKNGQQANLVLDGGNGRSGTYYVPNKTCHTPRSATFDQLLASSNIKIQCTANNAVGDAQHYNFAPRLGFAFRATPTLAIRGGYGIAYGALDVIGYGPNIGLNYPYSYVLKFNSIDSQTPLTAAGGSTATLSNALAAIDLQNPLNVVGNNISLLGRQYNFQTPYTETYNLTLQDQFTKNNSIQVAYVGTVGRHLDITGSANSVSAILPPGTNVRDTSVPGHIPLPAFGQDSAYESTNGESSYNSMQATYQYQASHGISTLANYTWSKCMTNQNTFGSGASGTRAEWLPGFGVSRDYALCDSDATHVVHASGTAELPVGRGKRFLGHTNHFVDEVIGGWVTNFIYTYQSGNPFTVRCPVATTESFGCNANVVSGADLYAGGRKVTQWLNRAAFSAPPVATQVGQSNLAPLGGEGQQARGPKYINLDMSLFKQFPIRESVKAEFRAEAFDLPNWTNLAQPGNLNINNSSNFSQIFSARDPLNPGRVLQLALKLYY